jgi:hypothetical protein
MNQDPYKSVFVFALTMLTAVIMASVVMIYVKMNAGQEMNSNYTDPVILLGIVAGAIVMPAGFFAYRNSIAKAKQQIELDDKIRGARTAIIIRSAIWEAGIMINLIAFFLYNSCLSLVMAGIVLLLFIAMLPFPSRIKNDLDVE